MLPFVCCPSNNWDTIVLMVRFAISVGFWFLFHPGMFARDLVCVFRCHTQRLLSRNARSCLAKMAFLRDTNSTHLEKASKNTNNILFQLLEREGGPTKSAQTVSKSSLICLVNIFPAVLFWLTLNSWQYIAEKSWPTVA